MNFYFPSVQNDTNPFIHYCHKLIHKPTDFINAFILLKNLWVRDSGQDLLSGSFWLMLCVLAQRYSGSLLTLQILRTHYSVLHVNLFLRASPGDLSISLFSGPKVDAFLHDSWLPRGRQWKLPNHKKLFCILLVKTVIWCAWVQGVKKQSAPVHGVIGRLCHRRAIRMGALIDVSFGLTNSFWGAERISQDSGSSWDFWDPGDPFAGM